MEHYSDVPDTGSYQAIPIAAAATPTAYAEAEDLYNTETAYSVESYTAIAETEPHNSYASFADDVTADDDSYAQEGEQPQNYSYNQLSMSGDVASAETCVSRITFH